MLSVEPDDDFVTEAPKKRKKKQKQPRARGQGIAQEPVAKSRTTRQLPPPLNIPSE